MYFHIHYSGEYIPTTFETYASNIMIDGQVIETLAKVRALKLMFRLST